MFVQKIKKYIEQNHLLEPGGRVLAAVSGGADSVCLFLVLKELTRELDFELRAVHVEHGIRGEESRRDAAFVQELCRREGISCSLVSVDVPRWAGEQHMGLEEAARALRYQVLERTARLWQAECGEAAPIIRIALAHHLEDNAETVLFRLCRGSGIGGLAGMRPERREAGISFIRPLLGISRREIENWLDGRGQEFCMDSTNRDLDYARNRMRQRVLPELSAINARTVEHINDSARQLAQIWDYLCGETRSATGRLVTVRETANGIVEVDIPGLLALHPALRSQVLLDALVQAAGRRRDMESRHVQQLLDLCLGQSGRGVDLPCGVRAERCFDRLVLTRACCGAEDGDRLAENRAALGKRQASEASFDPEAEQFLISRERLEHLRQSGETCHIFLPDGAEMTFVVREFDRDFQKISKKPCTKCLDYGMINDKLVIRHRLSGDRIAIRGGHSKKLKALLIQDRIPAEQRDRLWVVAEEQRILWAVGSRIGEDCKVTAKTKYVMIIDYRGECHGFQQET